MYYGYVESESLRNPLILNDYKPIKIEVEHVPTSKNHPYVHAYYLSLEDDRIAEEAEKFARETKSEWYLLFWNEEMVYAIFEDKVFQLPNEETWGSDQYKEIQKYGVDHGISIEYMDFNKNFARFRQSLSKK